MALKKTVFGSKSEEDVFNHLNSIWGEKIKIYHNLPFYSIIDKDTVDLKKYVSYVGKWKKILLMTSVDFVICNKKNKPLMCIEFDGMTGGYNKGTDVFQDREDILRKKKLELKLKIAKDEGLPFYIISYPETTELKNTLSKSDIDSINLTVVDGIIGQTMKNTYLNDEIDKSLEDYNDYLDSMDTEWEKDELIYNLVLDADVKLEFEWDPIAIKAAVLEGVLSEKNIISTRGWRYLFKPELPDAKLDVNNFFDIERLKRRIEAFKRAEWQGCEVYCDTPDGKIVRQVWIRNFEGTGASSISIVENIADLLVFSEIAKKYGIEFPVDRFESIFNQD